MTSKKMAIVSSYSESCGNAAFTKILHDSIEYFNPEVEVEIIELDLKLLQSINRGVRKKAGEHVRDICSRLKGYDLVNIQMEAGLYGTLPGDVVSRFKLMVSANPNTSVTLHSPRIVGSAQSGARSGIKKLLNFDIRGGLKDLIGNKYAEIHINVNKRIVEAAVDSGARLIVHTKRSKKQIKDFYSYENIIVHPLKMVPENYTSDSTVLDAISYEAGFSEDDVLVGMFGYISAYKGHIDALKAMENLPENYKLLIFGRQHPQTLQTNGQADAYMNILINYIQKSEKLKQRVFFMGELNDQDFLDVASNVDIAWLPYYENGQDGSGIASICLDLCPRVLCSTSFAFDELFKLVEYSNCRRFDIGNTLEMAMKTKMFLRLEKEPRPYSNEEVFSLRSQAAAYYKGGTV